MPVTNFALHVDSPFEVTTEPEISWVITPASVGPRALCNNTWLDPMTGTVCLMPKQMTPAYMMSFSGDMARLRKGDFSISRSQNWEEAPVGHSSNIFLLSKNAADDLVSTNASFPRNQSIFVSFFIFGNGGAAGNYHVLDLHFGGYILRVHSDGTGDLLDDDETLLVQGSLIGGDHYPVLRHGISGRYIRLVILPTNRHDILVITDCGGCLRYTNSHLNLETTNNTITAEDSVKFRFSHSKALIQIMKAAFPTTGTWETPPHDLGCKPATGRTITTTVYSDVTEQTNVTLALRTERGSEYVPDGTTQSIRAVFTLTSTSGSHQTPHLYGGIVNIEGVYTTRTGSSRTLQYRNLRNLDMTTMDVRVDPTTNPNVMGIPLGVGAGRTVSVVDELNRTVFEGMTTNISLVGAQAPAATIAAKDALWERLEHAVFQHDCRLDGLYDGEVILLCLRIAGIANAHRSGTESMTCTDRVQVSYGPRKLPYDPRGKLTLFLVRAGQSTAEVVRLVQDLWTNWRLNSEMVGGLQKAVFGPPDTSRGVQKTFYRSELSAGHEHRYWSDTIATSVARTQRYNGVVVRGRTLAGLDIMAEKHHEDAQNPHLAEADRPATWHGYPVIKLICDERLVTVDDCVHVCNVLYDRLVGSDDVLSWTAVWDSSAMVGSTVELEGRGSYRVSAVKHLGIATIGTEQYQLARYSGIKI